jgi:hypothetical protein
VDEETERRIEAARAESQRQKQTKEFLDSLTDKDSLVKPVYNPEAWAVRNKARAAASRGEIKPTSCRHPFQYLQQYQDDDPSVKRRGLDVNLFECGVCGMPLWLVDPFGNEKSDG